MGFIDDCGMYPVPYNKHLLRKPRRRCEDNIIQISEKWTVAAWAGLI